MMRFEKRVVVLVTVAILGVLTDAAAAPAITDVKAQQRYPWNDKVDIVYTVSSDLLTYAQANQLSPALEVRAVVREPGQAPVTNIATAAALDGPLQVTPGTHTNVWDLAKQGLQIRSANVDFYVSCKVSSYAGKTYLVIDLSEGADATSYPVSGLDAPPEGGWTDEYKTTKLVLRRVVPGEIATNTFEMGNVDASKTNADHFVTLTKGFYIGVFEVTQKQWILIQGSALSIWSNTSYGSGDDYPAYGYSNSGLTYQKIRGPLNARNLSSEWPETTWVDSSTLFGKLRAKTGLQFDLPTEYQWEYACRAGTGGKYYWGSANVGDYCWYSGNSATVSAKSSERTKHPVGGKLPNAWGLYDMLGNVQEMCRDWCASGPAAIAEDKYGVDPVCAKPNTYAANSYIIMRGGCTMREAKDCSATYRSSVQWNNNGTLNGFRLSIDLP